MPELALVAYLPTVRADSHDTVRALAAAIDASGAGFDHMVTRKMPVYSFGQRWHQRVMTTGVSKAAVNLGLVAVYVRGAVDKHPKRS